MLNVEISTVKIGTENYEILKPCSWVRFMDSEMRLDLILGTRTLREAEPALGLFWQRYEAQFPNHMVFQRAAEGRLILKNTLPCYFHADEGRTLKKRPLFLIQFQMAFGKGVGTKPSREVIAAKIKELKLSPNYAGNSLATRFLCALMHRSAYADQPELLDELLEHVISDMATLADEGLELQDGSRLWLATLGNKGDWDYLCKVAHLTRSYRNAPKFPTSKTPDKPMCHLCLAGSPDLPFEDVCLDVSYSRLCVISNIASCKIFLARVQGSRVLEAFIVPYCHTGIWTFGTRAVQVGVPSFSCNDAAPNNALADGVVLYAAAAS